MEDTTFRGYEVKKDTFIVANQYAVHYSKEIWGDPENFRPERFLSPDEKTVRRNDALIPFSVGKRQCLGMTYLFIACMLRYGYTKESLNLYSCFIHKTI
jgi:cytochrome P450